MIVGVDFDGTCVTNKFPSCGYNIGAGPVLRLLQSKGIILMLWTLRGNINKDWAGHVYDKPLLSDVKEWSAKEGIRWNSINQCPFNQDGWTDSNKQFADIYIDDMALGCPLKLKSREHGFFVDWAEVLIFFNRLCKGLFTPEELSETFIAISNEVDKL